MIHKLYPRLFAAYSAPETEKYSFKLVLRGKIVPFAILLSCYFVKVGTLSHKFCKICTMTSDLHVGCRHVPLSQISNLYFTAYQELPLFSHRLSLHNNGLSHLINSLSLLTNTLSLDTNGLTLLTIELSLLTNVLSLHTNGLSLLTNKLSLLAHIDMSISLISEQRSDPRAGAR